MLRLKAMRRYTTSIAPPSTSMQLSAGMQLGAELDSGTASGSNQLDVDLAPDTSAVISAAANNLLQVPFAIATAGLSLPGGGVLPVPMAIPMPSSMSSVTGAGMMQPGALFSPLLFNPLLLSPAAAQLHALSNSYLASAAGNPYSRIALGLGLPGAAGADFTSATLAQAAAAGLVSRGGVWDLASLCKELSPALTRDVSALQEAAAAVVAAAAAAADARGEGGGDARDATHSHRASGEQLQQLHERAAATYSWDAAAAAVAAATVLSQQQQQQQQSQQQQQQALSAMNQQLLQAQSNAYFPSVFYRAFIVNSAAGSLLSCPPLYLCIVLLYRFHLEQRVRVYSILTDPRGRL